MWCRRVMQIFIILIVIVINLGKCSWLTDSTNDLNQTNALKAIDSGLVEEGRKRKRKDNFFKTLVLGAVLVKLIIFPLAVKTMAVMSTISVLLSTLSLIMSSIVGYVKVAAARRPEPKIKVIHVNDVWAKGDEAPLVSDSLEYSPNVPLEQIHYNIKRK